MAVSNKLTDTKASKLNGESSSDEDEADLPKRALMALQTLECILRSGQNIPDDQLMSMLLGVLNGLQPTSVEKFFDLLFQYGFITEPVELDPDHTLKQKIQIIQEQMNQQKLCNILGCLRQLPETQELKNKSNLL